MNLQSNQLFYGSFAYPITPEVEFSETFGGIFVKEGQGESTEEDVNFKFVQPVDQPQVTSIALSIFSSEDFSEHTAEKFDMRCNEKLPQPTAKFSNQLKKIRLVRDREDSVPQKNGPKRIKIIDDYRNGLSREDESIIEDLEFKLANYKNSMIIDMRARGKSKEYIQTEKKRLCIRLNGYKNRYIKKMEDRNKSFTTVELLQHIYDKEVRGK